MFSILKNKIVDALRSRDRTINVSALGEEEDDFDQVFDACLNHLPANTGRVFAMREFLDLDIGEICRELGIASNNCYVILHRARHQLRACLEKTWFGQGA